MWKYVKDQTEILYFISVSNREINNKHISYQKRQTEAKLKIDKEILQKYQHSL